MTTATNINTGDSPPPPLPVSGDNPFKTFIENEFFGRVVRHTLI